LGCNSYESANGTKEADVNRDQCLLPLISGAGAGDVISRVIVNWLIKVKVNSVNKLLKHLTSDCTPVFDYYIITAGTRARQSNFFLKLK
jgi:hypothetical protein